MKHIGYLLIVLGLAWASWQELDGLLRARLRPVVIQQYGQLSENPATTYTLEAVQLRIRETALATYGAFPHPLPPCVLVLAGAFLVGRSRLGQAGRGA